MDKKVIQLLSIALFILALFAVLHEDYAFVWAHSGRISVSGSNFDFGTLPDTGSIAHTYTISNAGSGQLTIINASPSCGCTVVKLGKKVLQPREETTLVANISLSGKSPGAIEKRITITSNDEKNPVTELTMEGTLFGVPTSRHPMFKEGIFEGSCALCHADKGQGKSGAMLYFADCAVCHDPGHDPTAVDLRRSQWIGDARALAIISHGLRATNMPAFAKRDKGPLSDAQIISVIDYLRILHPRERAVTPTSRSR